MRFVLDSKTNAPSYKYKEGGEDQIGPPPLTFKC